MKLKLIALSLCLTVIGSSFVKGQSSNGGFSSVSNKHEIRLAASDGLTLTTVDIFGMGLADAIIGSKRSDEKSSLVYSLGYRYSISRFRLGGDLGFAQTSSKLALSGEKSPSIKERELNFLVLPTAEFIYYKRRLFELYGGASAGVNLVRHTESGLTEAGKKTAQKSSLSSSFAYQVNPIAFRVGNECVGGFVEAGLGNKGFLTAGISLRF